MTPLESLPPWAVTGIIIGGVVFILPLLATVLYIGSWVGRQQTELSGVKEDISDTQAEVKILRERNEDLSNQLAKHKQEIALEYVRHGALDKLETAIMKAIADIGRRIDEALLPRTKA